MVASQPTRKDSDMFEIYAYNMDGMEILYCRKEHDNRAAAMEWATHSANLIGAVSFELFENGNKILDGMSGNSPAPFFCYT